MPKHETGLGRGLGALLGDDPSPSGVSTLPIEKVEANRGQPRTNFDPEALEDLADSIRTHGILQPIAVRLLPSGYYQIISGERRWRAARMVGLREIPVVVLEANDRKVMELSLIENLQREDLNPLEEARGYQTLMREYGLSQEETARRVGKSRPAVANAVRLLQLSEPVIAMVEEGQLSAGHARSLLPVEDPESQQVLAREVVQKELSVRQTEALVKQFQKKQTEPEGKRIPGDEVDYAGLAAQALASRLGRKVRIVSGKRKGRVELEYYGSEDLNTLLELLERLPQADSRGDDSKNQSAH